MTCRYFFIDEWSFFIKKWLNARRLQSTVFSVGVRIIKNCIQNFTIITIYFERKLLVIIIRDVLRVFKYK